MECVQERIREQERREYRQLIMRGIFLKKQGRNNSILYATENDTIEKKNLMMQIKDELLE